MLREEPAGSWAGGWALNKRTVVRTTGVGVEANQISWGATGHAFLL